MAVSVSSGRVTIGPPTQDDLDWIMGHLADPAVATTLGWDGPVGSEIYSGYVEETVLLLPFSGRGSRSGFIMLMRPDVGTRVWTVNIVVPSRDRRDGFTAIAALDVMCHLVFDIRQDEGLEWYIEPGNLASKVLPKRLGYPKIDEVVRDGTTYERYGIRRPQWEDRQRRVERRGRAFSFAVADVPDAQVAHAAVIRAVRGGRPTADPAPSMSTRLKRWLGLRTGEASVRDV